MAEASYINAGDAYKFQVFNKDDLINTIETNITDKEIAYAILTHIEETIIKDLEEQKWVGIPYMGSLRIPPNKLAYVSEEQKSLREIAKAKLTEKQYAAFNRALNKENVYHARSNAYVKYVISMIAKKYKKLYKKLNKRHGLYYANMKMYSMNVIEAIISEEEKEIRYGGCED